MRLFPRKLVQYATVVLAILAVNFALPRLAPGDPLIYRLGEDARFFSPAELAPLRAQYGLDGSLLEQFGAYLTGIVTGDWGTSLTYGQPVTEVLLGRLPWTLLLVGTAGLLAGAIALWAALAGARRGERDDADILGSVLVVNSLPAFWLGMILLAIFSVELGLLPAFGATAVDGGILDVLARLVLPLTTLTLVTTAGVYLIARSALRAELSAGYVRFARAKGVPERRILTHHVLRNASLPIVTVFLAGLGDVLGGAVVVETVFSYPGVGSAIYEGVLARDFPMLQGALLLVGLGVVAANALADVLYAVIDPRVRAGDARPARGAARWGSWRRRGRDDAQVPR